MEAVETGTDPAGGTTVNNDVQNSASRIVALVTPQHSFKLCIIISHDTHLLRIDASYLLRYAPRTHQATMASPPPKQNRLADYELSGIIAKGSFGSVYRAVRKRDGRVFALKQVSLANMTKVDRQLAIDEARMLSQLHHPNIIKHYDSFVDSEEKLNILMEYASKGNVATLIKSFQGKPMPEDVVWRILIQALLGLSHIHSKRIIHRDIKALNLFIDAYDNIKIGDLGIARALGKDSEFASTIVGTPYYLAPELCEDKPYNEKSDVWALGVVMYECCMGRYPFDAQNPGALIRKILKGQFAPVQGPYTTAIVQLITSCLSFKPQTRPDSASLLRNVALVSKAKALGIDLNPRLTSAVEDKPVYDAPAQQPGAGGHPFAGAQNGSPGPNGAYGSPAPHQEQYQQPHPYQQGQVPYPPHHRPASANVPGARSPYQQQPPGRSQQQGGPPPADHPFALAGPQGGGYGAQYSPQQGYGSPAPGYQPSPRGGPYGGGQYQVQAPYQQPGQAANPWDRLAVDVNKMQLHESEVARHNAERQMVRWLGVRGG